MRALEAGHLQGEGRRLIGRGLAESQYVVHCVKAGGPAGEEASGPQRAFGKCVSAVRSVSEFYAFAVSREENGVVSYDIAPPNGVDSNHSLRPFACVSTSSINPDVVESSFFSPRLLPWQGARPSRWEHPFSGGDGLR